MRTILFGLAATALVAVGSLAPAKAQAPGGIGIDHRGGEYGGGYDQKYGGSYDQKYGGGYDKKYGGGYDKKYDGGYDQKYGGGYDQKYGGGYDNGHQRYRSN